MAEGQESQRREKKEYGGYDHEFVDKVSDRFYCLICTKVLRDPHLAVCCGQHYCESCLIQWFKKSHGKERCPHCRAEGSDFIHVIHRGMRSEINQLKIKCSHHRKGCKWTEALEVLKTHLESEKGCGFVIIQCPNKCKHTTVMRKDLEEHLNSKCSLRPYQCEYCGHKDSYEGITGIHFDECPAYLLTCPNKCGVDRIKRRDMADHRNKCPQEPIECPFAEVGCKNMICRHELDSHVTSSMQQHLLLVMGAYKQVNNELQETKAKLTSTEATLTTAVQLLWQGKEADKEAIDSIVTCLGYLKKVNDAFTVTMPRVSEYHRSGTIWRSAPFYFKEDYKMCLAVSIRKLESGVCTGVSIDLCLLKGEHDDQLKWPIRDEQCQPILPPPLPLPAPGIPFTENVWFHLCPLQQLQQTNKQLCCQEGACFHLVNDCLSFTVHYFIVFNFKSNTNSCDHLKLKVKCRHM